MRITENLAGKTLLEVGSGRGDTTRRLVELLGEHPGARLIATDISDAHFRELAEEFRGQPVEVRFLRTDACTLEGIEDASVDYVVCNYTLCAVEAQAGCAALALRRFGQVLRPGGWLLVEEEPPVDCATSAAQEVWAAKWRVLKAAITIAGGFPYAELAPETVAELCRMAGFAEVEWTAETWRMEGEAALDFFQQRLSRLLPQLPNDALRTGFREWAQEVRGAARNHGMEIPFYRLRARTQPGTP